MANVFISYRRSDYEKVGRLADEIRAAGHEVWLDEWEVELGDSIVARINDGLNAASYVVLCCSSQPATAAWIAREWMSTLARQLNGERVKILPALLSGDHLPSILADMKYADLSKDWSGGVAEILKTIK